MNRIIYRWIKRTPVAWLQTSYNPVKLAIGVAGVSFSNILIFFQLGLLDSVYNSQLRPIQKLDAELLMVSSGYSNFGSLQTFNRSRLFQTLGVEGVEGVSPMRIDRASWITPNTGNSYFINVFGINPSRPSLSIPELTQNTVPIRMLRNALFDSRTKSHYGPIGDLIRKDGSTQVEVNQQRLNMIGTFQLGATFAADANIIVSESTFSLLFPNQQPNQIQLGLIQLKKGVNPLEVQKAVLPILGEQVMVLTRSELSKLELNYWRRSSSIGFIFTIGVLVGFIVGSIIVYQILFGDVMNCLPQFATLKAMGYSDGYIISVVVQQGAILAVVGFIPGLIFSIGLYSLLANATNLAVAMTATRAVQVLVLTIVMCTGSAALATRKLIKLDPADVF
tara:strand:+ start:667 stop:1842 length:1176 start_codon:yes stop_codon:yes gene_type:complete